MIDLVDYRPISYTRGIGLELTSSGTCRSKLSFGNRFDVEIDGIRCEHLSVMTVGCFLEKGHEGPHRASRENYWPAESIDHLADHDFTLTWEDR